jgi:HSP20 family protein
MSLYVQPYSPYLRRPALHYHSLENEVHVPLDVIAESDAYVIEMILPGLAPDEVDIEIVEKTIEIQGEFKTAPEDVKYLRKERPNGKFHRIIRLPKLLDMEKSEARLENGVLSLRVPVAEEALPKTIKIKAK